MVGANTSGFHFQMTNPKFQDERVRRAFCTRSRFRRVGRCARYTARPAPGACRVADPLAVRHDRARPRGAEQVVSVRPRTGPTDAPGRWLHASPTRSNGLPSGTCAKSTRPDRDRCRQDPRDQGRTSARSTTPPRCSMLNARDFDDTMNVTGGPGLLRRPGRVPLVPLGRPVSTTTTSTTPRWTGSSPHSDRKPGGSEDRDLARQRDPHLRPGLGGLLPTGTFRRTFWHNYLDQLPSGERLTDLQLLRRRQGAFSLVGRGRTDDLPRQRAMNGTIV